ncbi:MAG: heme ABC transporter permease CcmC [Hydrogenophilus sp.]|nr:heme ABC transporter permease CcmC [Hydrogenophilus sp.]
MRKHPIASVEERAGSRGGIWRFASPPEFFRLCGMLAPWFAGGGLVLGIAGLYGAFFVAPPDFRQGEVYRIIYIHVPAAWMSMIIYLAMAFWGVVGLVLNTRVSFVLAHALAPTGALWCFVALWSGALWGKPTWGTYWAWDARMTSQLLLLFLYLGYMALVRAIDEPRRADRAGALVAIVGAVNVPIIYFSVQWWNTLHQGASVSLTKAPAMATVMVVILLVMTLAVWFYSIAVALWRARALLLQRERGSVWAQEAARRSLFKTPMRSTTRE